METAIKIDLPKWDVEEQTGYKPQTTFWQDFSIADRFGAPAVRDTYRRAFNEWKGNHKYLTELALVLNHKIWQQWDSNRNLAETYDRLWRETGG